MFSDKNTTITDDINFYSLKKFKFLIDEEQLSGEKIIINSNYKLPDNDKYYFSSGIVDFKNNSFVAKDTEVKIHKSIFNNSNNDPRIKGVSSKKMVTSLLFPKVFLLAVKKMINVHLGL